jgi:hypothetical protein
MKASELRIGNLIGFNYGNRKTYSTITEITSIDVKLNDGFAELSQLEPIPLTEKWLLRFGYIKFEVNATIFCEYSLVDDGVLKYKLLFDKRNNNIVMPNEYKPIKIKHVHQLQNLYFALTGEELILKA